MTCSHGSCWMRKLRCQKWWLHNFLPTSFGLWQEKKSMFVGTSASFIDCNIFALRFTKIRQTYLPKECYESYEVHKLLPCRLFHLWYLVVISYTLKNQIRKRRSQRSLCHSLNCSLQPRFCICQISKMSRKTKKKKKKKNEKIPISHFFGSLQSRNWWS